MIPAGVQAAPPERVRAVVDDVLSRPEFGREPDWVESKIAELLEWFGGLFGISGGEFALFSFIVLGALVGALLLWVVWLFVRNGLGLRRRDTWTEDGPADERARNVADLRRRAAACAAAGDRVGALRLYFFALVVGLGERGELEFRDAWTNRELLDRGHPRPDVERLLRPLVAELDAVSFGHAPASDEDVARMEELCTRFLGAGSAAP